MIRSTKELSCEYLREFLEEYEYPGEAIESLLSDLKTLMSSDEARVGINALLLEYRDESYDYLGSLSKAKGFFKIAGVGEYQGSFIFVAHLASTMRELYAAQGIGYDIWFDTLMDLKYKAFECILIHKVWGTFVAFWYKCFTEVRIVALGRLQFEKKLLGMVGTVKGIELREDTPVLSVHIPTTGTPLDRESFTKSYAMAIEFFKDSYFHGEPVKFYCGSWLLFPRLKEMLKPTSNVVAFGSDYELIAERENEDYKGTWRVFDCLITEDTDISSLPEDNSMRRGYKKLMLAGEKTGIGVGVYIPD